MKKLWKYMLKKNTRTFTIYEEVVEVDAEKEHQDICNI